MSEKNSTPSDSILPPPPTLCDEDELGICRLETRALSFFRTTIHSANGWYNLGIIVISLVWSMQLISFKSDIFKGMIMVCFFMGIMLSYFDFQRYKKLGQNQVWCFLATHNCYRIEIIIVLSKKYIFFNDRLLIFFIQSFTLHGIFTICCMICFFVGAFCIEKFFTPNDDTLDLIALSNNSEMQRNQGENYIRMLLSFVNYIGWNLLVIGISDVSMENVIGSIHFFGVFKILWLYMGVISPRIHKKWYDKHYPPLFGGLTTPPINWNQKRFRLESRFSYYKTKGLRSGIGITNIYMGQEEVTQWKMLDTILKRNCPQHLDSQYISDRVFRYWVDRLDSPPYSYIIGEIPIEYKFNYQMNEKKGVLQ